MWKKSLQSMAILLIALMASQANAQGIGIGPQIGYQKAQDADSGKLMGGLAMRLRLMPVLGVEGSINYRQEKFANSALTVRNWPVMVTGLIYPAPVVYGAIGAGWYNTTFDYDQRAGPLQVNDEKRQAFGWHFGGGLELPVSPGFRLTTDLRYVFLNYDFKAIPGSNNLKSNSYIFTVGCLFGR